MGFLDDLLNIGGQIGDAKSQVEETVQGATEPLQDVTSTAEDVKQQASDATGSLLGGEGNEEK